MLEKLKYHYGAQIKRLGFYFFGDFKVRFFRIVQGAGNLLHGRGKIFEIIACISPNLILDT